MGLLRVIEKRWMVLSFCMLSGLFGFLKHGSCQDLSSPRFFTFNVQSLSSSNAPVVPRYALNAVAPNEAPPNVLYEFALRFPIKMKGRTQLFGEIAHKNEYFSGIFTFERDHHNALEPIELFESSASLILLRDLNPRWKLFSVLNVRSNANRTFHFGRAAMRYSNITLLEKKVPKGKLGFGTLVSYNQQRISILPILKYEVRLNDKWGLDILLPSQALVTRDLSKSTRLLFGVKGDAANYFLTGDYGLENPVPAKGGANFRRLSINGVVGIEKQITPMVGFTAEAGASFPYQVGIVDAQQPRLGLHDFRNGVAPHFRIGFFLSLPR